MQLHSKQKLYLQRIFWLLVAVLNETLHIAITTVDWGRLYKLLYVLSDARICSMAMCKCNTLIEAAILFLSHPYLATLP